jgi:hypothetical protein
MIAVTLMVLTLRQDSRNLGRGQGESVDPKELYECSGFAYNGVRMSVARKPKVTVEEVVELAGQLPVKDRLRVISKLADGLTTTPPPKKRRKPITQYAAVGMWKDREDMKDSVAWVRALRKQVSVAVEDNDAIPCAFATA